MKKIALTLIAHVLFILAASNSFGQEQVPTPTFQDGDSWQFKAREWDYVASTSVRLNGVYELQYSQSRVRAFLVDNSGQKAEELRRGGREFTILTAMLGRGDTKLWQVLQFPLFVGKKWDYEYRVGTLGAGPSTYTRSAEIRVTGIEEITTPGGKFRAFKIEKEDWSGRSRWATTCFYSPDAKSIVKFFYDTSVGGGDQGKTETELIKFGSAR